MLLLIALTVVGCSVFDPRSSTGPSDACASTGCAVLLHTSERLRPGEACPMRRIGGFLAADATYGLGVRDRAGEFAGVVWPFGYSARREANGIVLLDRSGVIVAREGDLVAMAGTVTADLVQHPCFEPELEVVE